MGKIEIVHMIHLTIQNKCEQYYNFPQNSLLTVFEKVHGQAA